MPKQRSALTNVLLSLSLSSVFILIATRLYYYLQPTRDFEFSLPSSSPIGSWVDGWRILLFIGAASFALFLLYAIYIRLIGRSLLHQSKQTQVIKPSALTVEVIGMRVSALANAGGGECPIEISTEDQRGPRKLINLALRECNYHSVTLRDDGSQVIIDVRHKYPWRNLVKFRGVAYTSFNGDPLPLPLNHQTDVSERVGYLILIVAIICAFTGGIHLFGGISDPTDSSSWCSIRPIKDFVNNIGLCTVSPRYGWAATFITIGGVLAILSYHLIDRIENHDYDHYSPVQAIYKHAHDNERGARAALYGFWATIIVAAFVVLFTIFSFEESYEPLVGFDSRAVLNVVSRFTILFVAFFILRMQQSLYQRKMQSSTHLRAVADSMRLLGYNHDGQAENEPRIDPATLEKITRIMLPPEALDKETNPVDRKDLAQIVQLVELIQKIAHKEKS